LITRPINALPRIGIIGAGMAGLACACKLSKAGLSPVIFDKGRGIGGRMATKRVDQMQFDHGAQYVTARDGRFAAILEDLQYNGAAANWDDGSNRSRIVGVPGMSGLPRAMSAELDIQQLAQVTAVRAGSGGWTVQIGDQAHHFDKVVITVPAPQLAGLLGQDHPFVTQTADVRFAPCQTLMAVINAPATFASRRDDVGPLSWIAHDGSKPDRPQGHATAWVAQASPSFSEQHLEDDAPAITARMLPLLCDELNVATDAVIYASAHRWRYARVTAPLGQPFLHHAQTLYAGGDWCIGPRVEAAWVSGDAIAQHILQSPF
jgi:predicted NAD/FAD-dependent oxidoreductase